MSTKKLGEALEEARESAIDAGVYDSEVSALLAQATVELDAIRAAARVLAAEARGDAYSESDRAMALVLLAEIAKEET